MQAAPRIRRLFGAPLVITLFFLGMMLPTSVSVSVGGLRLSVYRVVLLVALVPMLAALITGKKGRFNGFDALAIGHSVWAMLALQHWGGLGQGTQSGGFMCAVSRISGPWRGCSWGRPA